MPDATPAEINPPPMSAESLGRVALKNAGGNTEIQKIIDAMGKGPTLIDQIAGKGDIPDGVIKAILTSNFPDGAPTAGNMKDIHDNLDKSMKDIKEACNDFDKAKPYLQNAIEQSGLSSFFNSLSAGDKDALLKGFWESGVMRSIGRQKFLEVAATGDRGGRASALEKEVKELKDQKTKAQDRITSGLDPILGGGFDAAKTNAEKVNLTRKNEVSTRKIDEANRQIGIYEERLSDIESDYRSTIKPFDATKFKDALDADPRYKDIDKKIKDQETIVKDEQTKIDTNNTQLEDLEKKLQASAEKGQLEQKINELSTKIATKEGELITAQADILKQVNELLTKFQGVLPEAAKEALVRYERMANAANKARLVEEAEKKVKDTKESEKEIAQAEKELTEALARRYTTSTSKTSEGKWWYRDKGATSEGRVDRTKLAAEFQILMTQGSGPLLDVILADPNCGIDPALITKMGANADLKRDFKLKMMSTVYSTVATDGVLKLGLDGRSLEAYGLSDEFIKAGEAAIARDTKLKTIIENVAGKKLGADSFGDYVRKLPGASLWGLILLLFGGLKNVFVGSP